LNKKPFSFSFHWLYAIILLLIMCWVSYDLYSSAQFVDLAASQKRDQVLGSLDAKHTYRYSFISNSDYLSKIEIPLLVAPHPDRAAGYILVQFLNEDGTPILDSKYSIPTNDDEFVISLEFTPQKASQNHRYFILLQTQEAPDAVFVLGSEYDAMPNAALQINGGVTPYDLAFFSYSRPPPLVLLTTMLRSSFLRTCRILLLGFVLFLSGYGVSTALFKKVQLGEFVIYTCLLSIVIPPILFFLLSFAGLKLERTWLIVLPLSGLLVFLFQWAFKRMPLQRPARSEVNEWFLIGSLFLLALLTRVEQVKDLIVPSGIGFQNHQKIIERILDNGAIPLESIYHIGFHVDVVFLHFIANWDLPQVTLEFGQWLGILCGLSFYLLARRLLTPSYAAFAATALYWFVSPVPSFFINISRYPYLQGLVLLPGALALVLEDSFYLTGRKIAISLFMAGLLLTHFGSFIIFGALTLAIYLYGRFRWQFSLHQFTSLFKPVALIFAPSSLVLTIKMYFIVEQGPWLSFVSQKMPAGTLDDLHYVFLQTLEHGGLVLWLAGMAGLFLLYTRRIILFWGSLALAFVLFVLNWLQIAVVGHVASNTTDLLFCFLIPLSLLAGYVLSSLRRGQFLSRMVFGILIICGAYNISGITNPRNVFFTSADQKAVTWIRQNTPPKSVFLVNSYPWDGHYKPTDGGYWISHLADRKVVFPASHVDDSSIPALFEEIGPDYVYFGSGYGALTPLAAIQQHAALVYNQDGIYIYEVHKPLTASPPSAVTGSGDGSLQVMNGN
jgi:hypothetical protein